MTIDDQTRDHGHTRVHVRTGPNAVSRVVHAWTKRGQQLWFELRVEKLLQKMTTPVGRGANYSTDGPQEEPEAEGRSLGVPFALRY